MTKNLTESILTNEMTTQELLFQLAQELEEIFSVHVHCLNDQEPGDIPVLLLFYRQFHHIRHCV